MKWSAHEWLAKAERLSAIYSEFPDEAAWQLRQHRHFIKVADADYDFVSAHRVVHGLMGKSLVGGPRSGQNIKKITSALSRLGFCQIEKSHEEFELHWEQYLALCRKSGNAGPSGGKVKQPKDRSFFVPTARSIQESIDHDALSPRDAARFGGDFEGAAYQVTTNRYERKPSLRSVCIAFYREKHGGRLRCESCHFDFEITYGDIGANFIHVHHKDPLGDRQLARLVEPTRDLVPLCPNCHAMTHRGLKSKQKPRTVEDLSRLRNFR